MPEERRQFRILYRDFLFRILDLELLASRGEAQRLLGQFGAMLAAFSLTFTVYFVPRYGLTNLPFPKIMRLGWVDQDLLIATTMAIAGMFTILAWNNVLPDRRDCLILGLLPLRARTVFLAKLAALGTALGVAVTALNVFTGLAYPLVIAPPGSGCAGILRALGSYWVTMFAAGLLVCCTLLAMQALAALLLSYRVFLKVSSFLQMAGFFVILGVYFLKPAYSAGLTWLPSFWFLGLFQQLNGSHEFDALAGRALQALYLVCPLAMVAFSVAFQRYNRRIVEQPDIAPTDRSRPSLRIASLLAGKMVPRSVEQAIVLFTARTIARSRHHRLLLAAYGGIGLAVALAYARDLLYGSHSFERLWLNPKWNQPNAPLLVGSLVLLFFAAVGARAVFSQPIALRSNWIFRITAVQKPAAYFAGVRQSLFLLVVMPIVLGWAAIFLTIWPAAPALKHVTILLAAGILMVQLLLTRFRKIPFACSYLPGKANMHVKLGIYGVAFLFATSLAVQLEYSALYNATVYVSLLATLLAYAAWAYRRNIKAPEAEILFEETEPTDIEALDLHGRGPRGGRTVKLPPPEIPRAPFSLEQFFRDLIGATRILTKSPGFSAAVIALIAVGIGGNASIYSMVHAVLSKKAPGITADNLVTFGAMRGGRTLDPGEHSYPEYLDYATSSRTMRSIAAIEAERFNLTLPDGSSYRLRGQLVTRNYFQTIGLAMALGREFTVDEARGAAPLATIITYPVWQMQFHQTADVLGQSVMLNGHPATIVGVTPPYFHGTSLMPNLEICVPIVSYSRLRGTEANLIDREKQGIGIIGQLAPGSTLAQAQAEFDQLSRMLFPDLQDPTRALLARYTATAFGPNSGPQARAFLAILMAMAVLMLLVVCANAANLLLARAISRQREMAVRLSLGAPRSRILRMLLAEGLVLSLAATAAALFFASWITRAIVVLFPPLDSGGLMDADLTPDWRVALYALLLAIVCTVAFSLTPAVRLWRQQLLPSLKRGEHGVVGGRSKAASILMVAQLALCVVLLTGGGLAWRSLSLIDTTDLGFSRDHLLLATVSTQGVTNDRRQAAFLLEDVRERIAGLPEVDAASWAVAAPPHSHSWMGISAQVVGGASVPTDGTFVGPDYLKALGVHLLAGRTPEISDLSPSTVPAVVNGKLAEALWPGQSAVGKSFLLEGNTVPLQVFAVVPNGAFNGVGSDGSFSGLAKSERRPFIFLPDEHSPGIARERTFHIRYRGSLTALVPAVRSAIHETDSRLTVFGFRTMEAEWEEFTSPIRILVTLVGCFAIAALFVATVGLYAVVAFYTGKHTRELGIRTALGASPSQALRLIMKEGLRLTAWGLSIGLAICAIAGGAFAHRLFGVSPTDGITWLGVIALMTAVSVGACGGPACRAARVDPMKALREE